MLLGNLPKLYSLIIENTLRCQCSRNQELTLFIFIQESDVFVFLTLLLDFKKNFPLKGLS